ncbi:thioredoxin family protein [Magnetococcales bacterium HHB-1]
MPKKRSLLLTITTLTLLFFATPASHALQMEPFFQDSFLNMSEDAQDAADSGKILMLFFEQDGCPYCSKLHKETLKDPKVIDYLTKNFHAVLIDIYGARSATDFQNRTATEKKFSRRLGVHFTPTVAYFDKKGEELFRISGYWKPFHFLASMEFVKKGLYKKQNFQDYIHKKIAGEKMPAEH